MRFGPVPVDQAEGAILAHSQTVAGRKIGKGRPLTAEDIAALGLAGLAEVTVARPEPGDVAEDAAADLIARALVPDPGSAGLSLSRAHAGRVNLIATGVGIVQLDRAAIGRLNRIDPAITLATLAPFARVSPGALVGTVKIIAYAVPGAALAGATATAPGAVSVLPVRRRTASLILTRAAGAGAKLAAKGREAVTRRLERLGITLGEVLRTDHRIGPLAAALTSSTGELVLILTGAATSDLHDVAPEAVRQAGGTVARFGMPVDPGNLLFLGSLGARPVIGLPGCARSPALNGADWVLERTACGIALSDDDIAEMGVGGLLKEIPSRPQPRLRAPDRR